MAPNMSLFAVNAILLLSTSDASRILTRYYAPPHAPAHAPPHAPGAPAPAGANPYPLVKEQKAFEKGLVEKTGRLGGDVILYDNRVVVFKSEGDVGVYVVGGAAENEVLLYAVVLGLRDVLSILLKTQVDRRSLVENYDLVALAIDEMVDAGIILETDAVVVAGRVSRPAVQEGGQMGGLDLSEEGLVKIYQLGKAKLGERLRQGL